MKRFSTRCMHKYSGIRKRNPGKQRGGPREQTIDFLSQFARVYRAEPSLQQDICSFIMN
ncbi:hypothetical protein M2101_001574 [Parabacteroides sp. PM5-20]|uniref:hypothetical protein n=1 Tax=unclassified Parabacteroides TaxID=2649774 RepID=UPI0013D59C62|nr:MULTISPECIES: hypothetical protein [unclassified Parabacteroides]MDH6534897.1 hypothetical protein [Parabacteroides sp. PM5-20]